MHTYQIRNLTAKRGEAPTLQEPIVGKWYCGFTVYTDERNGDSTERDGALARYEGEGCWSDDDPESDIDPDMSDYDYLQEQF